jgi:hypothetical protein
MPKPATQWRMPCKGCRICWPTRRQAEGLERRSGRAEIALAAGTRRAVADRLSLRPRLPLAGQPTGPDALLDRTLAAIPLEPVPLDPVSVSDDPGYAGNLQAQRNLPAAIKEALKTFYPA